MADHVAKGFRVSMATRFDIAKSCYAGKVEICRSI